MWHKSNFSLKYNDKYFRYTLKHYSVALFWDNTTEFASIQKYLVNQILLFYYIEKYFRSYFKSETPTMQCLWTQKFNTKW